MWDDKKGLSLDISSCKPLREIVFETIRCAIITGELQPGQRLMRFSWQNKWGSAEHRSENPSESLNWKAW